MLTNESCTLYLKSGSGFDRVFVPRCHWQGSQSGSVGKSGAQNADSVTVYIFAKDIPAALTARLKARRNAAEDMIVPGECSFTFDNSTPQSASQSLRAFTAAAEVHTVMKLEKLLCGSPNLRHFKLTAR